jgi:epoxide hydrolase-like predicted phosphatase
MDMKDSLFIKRAIIWDLGGVLVRTEDASGRERLAERLGVTRLEIEELVFSSDSSRRAQSGEISEAAHWEYVRHQLRLSDKELKDFHKDFWGGDRLDNDLVDYIRSLSPRYKIGLLSNNFHGLRRALIEEWKIDNIFNAIIISAEVHLLKPDSRIYRLALDQLGVLPEEAIFIDDFVENLAGAQRVGMHRLQFYNTQQVIAELSRIINPPLELKD